jgi:hypothetical protein
MRQSRRWRFRYDCKPLDFVDADSRARYYDSLRKNNAASGDDIRQLEGLKRKDLPATTSYENPNTSSGSSEPEEQTEAEPEAAAMDPLKIRCLELAESELKKLEHCADCVNHETFARRLDKQLGLHGQALTRVANHHGIDANRVSMYTSDRKAMIQDRVIKSQSHQLEPLDSADDVAKHIYNTLFGANGKS